MVTKEPGVASIRLDLDVDYWKNHVLQQVMLAGYRPFRGSNDLEVLKAIIHGVAAGTPAALTEGCDKINRKLQDKS